MERDKLHFGINDFFCSYKCETSLTTCLFTFSVHNIMQTCDHSVRDIDLTRNRGGNFWMHPKTWCLNFEPQYLQNYSSPRNDLYSVQKRSIRAFKSIVKLLDWASPHWLRTLRQNVARVVSLAAVQLVSKHSRASLT